METVSSKFPTAKKLATWIGQQLRDVEAGTQISDAMLDENFSDLSRQLQQLQQLVQREPAQRRQMWRRRIDQLGEEATSLRAAHKRAAAVMTRARNSQCELPCVERCAEPAAAVIAASLSCPTRSLNGRATKAHAL